MVKKGHFWAWHLPPTVLLHVLMQQPPLFRIWILHCALFMERRDVVGELRCPFFFYEPSPGNPISPASLLLFLGYWEIHPVWFYWPLSEGKFKFQAQPISPTLPDTSNITLNPGKCLFKISKIIGVFAPKCRRGNLPSVLTSFQHLFLVYINIVGTGRNNFLL